MGLPSYIRNRLNKSDIENQGDLLTELENLKILVRKEEGRTQNPGNPSLRKRESDTAKQKDFKACQHCEKLGYSGRFHPENQCWNNPNGNNYRGNNDNNKKSSASINKPIKIANNVELQDAFNQAIPDPRNLN